MVEMQTGQILFVSKVDRGERDRYTDVQQSAQGFCIKWVRHAEIGLKSEGPEGDGIGKPHKKWLSGNAHVQCTFCLNSYWHGSNDEIQACQLW